MKWIPFNCKTHFSLLKAFSKCDKLAAKCKEYGYRACVITDMECLSGAVNFHESCHKHGIKPILGCDFGTHLLIAKNKDGWFDLIKIVSHGGLALFQDLAKKGNLICITNEHQAGYKRRGGGPQGSSVFRNEDNTAQDTVVNEQWRRGEKQRVLH